MPRRSRTRADRTSVISWDERLQCAEITEQRSALLVISQTTQGHGVSRHELVRGADEFRQCLFIPGNPRFDHGAGERESRNRTCLSARNASKTWSGSMLACFYGMADGAPVELSLTCFNITAASSNLQVCAAI